MDSSIPHYLKKAERVQALQITPENLDRIVEWTHGIPVREKNAVTDVETVGVIIPTMHGKIRGGEREIVLRQNGEWRIMPFSQFQQEYS